MTDHALTGGDCISFGKTVLNRMSRFILGNRGIRTEARATIPKLPVGARGNRRAIIRIDHVTSRAATGSIITRVIIGSQEVERRVKEARFRCTNDRRIGSILRAQTSVTETSENRSTGGFILLGNTCFRSELTTTLKDTKDITGLSDLETGQGGQCGDDASFLCFPLCGLGNGL